MMRYFSCMALAFALLFGFSACSSDEDTTAESADVDQDEDQTTATIDSDYIYKLPVIFHVLYSDATDPSQYVPASRLQEILGYVNNLYLGNIYGTEYGSSENIKVQFQLAKYNESGKELSTPGVEYIHWTDTYPIDAEDFMSNSNYTKYIWEPNDYINVMVYNFDNSGTVNELLGISHLPYVIEGDNDLEGLTVQPEKYRNLTKANLSFPYCSSINSVYAYKDKNGNYYQSDRYTNSSHRMFEQSVTLQQVQCDIVVTLAHELGHYLGLLHAFSEIDTEEGETYDGCEDTDYCDDTPTYNRTTYLDDLTDYFNSIEQGTTVSAKKVMLRQNCDGEDFYSYNIEDYAYTYGFQLTKEQKHRIREVLYNSPLMPGPKLSHLSTRAAKPIEGIVDLPIKTIK